MFLFSSGFRHLGNPASRPFPSRLPYSSRPLFSRAPCPPPLYQRSRVSHSSWTKKKYIGYVCTVWGEGTFHFLALAQVFAQKPRSGRNDCYPSYQNNKNCQYNLCLHTMCLAFFGIIMLSPYLKELRHRSCILKKLAKLFKIVISNPFQSSPSSAILVPYCFRITPLVFFLH